MDSADVVISQPALGITLSPSIISNVSCFGGADGSANVLAQGGTSPYTYLWSDGQSTATAQNLTAGTYSVVVTDSRGCLDSASVTITEPLTPVGITLTLNNGVNCFSGNDGSATAQGVNGTSPYSYLWDNGSTSATATNLSFGYHSVTVTDLNGCSSLDSILIPEPDSAVSVSIVVNNNVSCLNGSDGQLTAVGTGGTAPYSFDWDTFQSTAQISNLTAGTYRVTITDSNGCQDTISAIITQPATALTLSTSVTQHINCFGDSTGSVSAVAGGGVPPYDYSWSNGGTSANQNNLTAGWYTITLTDSAGCQLIDSVEITQPSAALSFASSVATDIICFGANDGTVSAMVSGGTTPYTYAWSNGSSAASQSGLSAGTYSLLVTDANGCTISDTLMVDEPNELIITLDSKTDIDCFGLTNGAVSISVSGGIQPYDISWNTGDTTTSLSNIAAGDYTVTVVDSNGCIDSLTVNISQPSAALSAIPSVISDVNCFGGSDGEGYVAITGGTAPYSILWNNGSTNDTLFNLTAGSYSATITDSLGCTANASFSILQPSQALVIDSSANSDVTCSGYNNGSAGIVVSGGTAPYSYSWNNGGVTSTINGLSSGQYTVTVTDANGCSVADTFVVAEPSLLLVSQASLVHVDCFGNANGSASINATGGTTPYTITWSNGATGNSITNVAAGTYTAVVTDANGCSDSLAFTITQPSAALTATGNITSQVNCFGGNDGEAYVAITGGTAPYTISWDHGASTDTITGLTSGTYTATITDANGCTATASVGILQPSAPLAISASTSTDVTCFGANDGTVGVTVTGGTTPYSYAWSNGSNASSQTGLAAGTYSVTITDANGCSVQDTMTIAEPTQMALTQTSLVNVDCFGNNSGSASINATGGTTPYTITWSNGASGNSITNVSAGTYTAVVTDANGCSDSLAFTITQPSAALTATGNITSQVNCFGGNDGEAYVAITGGTAPYTISWDHGASTDTITGLTSGTYTATITDANGCTATESVTITQPLSPVTSSISSQTDVSCNGGSDGSSTLTISGGVAPYSVTWTSGFSGRTINNLPAGTHVYTVLDANGCEYIDSVTISEPPVILMTKDVVTHVSCFGHANGFASATISGGVSPYTYSWSNGGNNSSINNIQAGNYVLTVTDANGCSDTLLFIIHQPSSSLTANVGVISNVTCFNGNDGSVYVSPAGGTAPYSISWSNGSTNDTINQLSGGVYIATITDANGCMDSVSVSITEPTSSLTATVSYVQDIMCYGEASGAIGVEVTGGEAPYYYTWNNGMSTDSIYNLSSGTYNLTVTDNRGCQVTLSQTLNQPSQALTASTQMIQPVLCFNEDDGIAQVSITGGTPPYIIGWSNGDSTLQASLLPIGTHTVNVTDANGCQITESVNIIGPSSELEVLAEVDNPKCGLIDNGKIILVPIGGSAPYNVKWNHGPTGTTLNNVSPGKYMFEVTDNFGCTIIDSVFVLNTPELSATVTIDSVSCKNASDGSIDVTVQSGIGPFEYYLNNQPFNGYAGNLASGVYEVSIFDGVGCDSTFIVDMQIDRTDFYLHIPNAYTPNGDGINEKYEIVGSECFEDAYFEIVDRWGSLMFRTNDPFNEFWDGIRPDGTIAPQDVYGWRFVSKGTKRLGTVVIVQ